MVRESRPPAREAATSWPARRSTMATSTFASASSAASIMPVGPPPAISTACSVMTTFPPDTSTPSSARSQQRLEVADRPEVPQLVGVDDRVDPRDPTAGDLERHHADQPLSCVEEERSRAAVDLHEAQGH